MSDLIRGLLEKMLGWAQHHLYAKPPKPWKEIDGIDRAGRLALMTFFLVLVLAPLGWVLFG